MTSTISDLHHKEEKKGGREGLQSYKPRGRAEEQELQTDHYELAEVLQAMEIETDLQGAISFCGIEMLKQSKNS